MLCRVCKSQTVNIYISGAMPECIWPAKKTKFSKCKVFSCTKCYHLQLQNFTKSQISKFYGKIQYNLNKSEINKNRLEIIKKNFGSNILKKKSLDIGGGINPILKHKNIFIADFKIQKKNKIKFKGRYYELDIENGNIDNKFDNIFMMHTLEHLKYPKKAMIKIINLLKKNGLIFIEIPNFEYYTKKNTYYAIFHQHLSMFTISHLKNFLKICNLSIHKVLIKSNVIFIAVTRNNINDKRVENILKINNKKIFRNFRNNLYSFKKKILYFLKNKKFNIYGAGGSMALVISMVPKLKKNIEKIFDNDAKKISKFLPGTSIKIEKKKLIKSIISISSYNLNKNKNFNVLKF